MQFAFPPENRRGGPQMPLLKPMRCCANFWFQSSRSRLARRAYFNPEEHDRGWLKCDGLEVLAAAFPVNRSAGSYIFERKDDLAPLAGGPEQECVFSRPTENTLDRTTIEPFSDVFATTSTRSSVFQSKSCVAPVLDARRGEIYGGVYDASLRLVREEGVMPFEAWIAALSAGLPQGDIEIVTNGFVLPAQPYPVIQAPRALAGAIAQIAARRFSLGLAQDPAEIDANYVRRSDAELFWKESP